MEITSLTKAIQKTILQTECCAATEDWGVVQTAEGFEAKPVSQINQNEKKVFTAYIDPTKNILARFGTSIDDMDNEELEDFIDSTIHFQLDP